MKTYPITPINLSDSSLLDSRVENRRVFSLPQCELNIFETIGKCNNVILSYSGGLVVSSMMRGKKVLSAEGLESFDFLPGETIILPEGLTMKVNFPEADNRHPVQCATLALDWDMVRRNLDFLNENYPKKHPPFEWKLNFGNIHFNNNIELADSINKLIKLSMENNPAKDAMADLSLKLFLLRLIQTQNLISITTEPNPDNRLQPAMDYMHSNFTNKITVSVLARKSYMSESAFYKYFKERFGTTPQQYILRLRIDHAKKMMSDSSISIQEVGYGSGFNSLNHFIKIFKRMEGVTPGSYIQ